MRIKSFYGKTMAEVLQEIKDCLGSEALILSTKEVPRRSGLRGFSSGFEVVAAVDGPEGRSAAPLGEALPVVRSGQCAEDPVPAEAGDTDTSLYSPASIFRRHRPVQSGMAPDGDAGVRTGGAAGAESSLPFQGATCLNLYRDLIENGVQDWLAKKLVNDALAELDADQRLSKPDVVRALTKVAKSLVSIPERADGVPAKKIVVFFGPTGVGKTTAIAKLAARLALQMRKKVVLMTLDDFRVGAVEQLRTYARFMGIPFRLIRHPADLPKAIEENAQRDYILVDTAGRGPRDNEGMNDLAAFLQDSVPMERHLVLSATTKPADLKSAIDRFELCRPDHLVFTKLDETSTLGPILNELVRTRKPLSYYTDGQKVPEHLHAVSGERFISMVLNLN